eukprot:160472_1
MSGPYRGGGGYYGYNDQYPYDYPQYYDNRGYTQRRGGGGGGYRRNYNNYGGPQRRGNYSQQRNYGQGGQRSNYYGGGGNRQYNTGRQYYQNKNYNKYNTRGGGGGNIHNVNNVDIKVEDDNFNYEDADWMEKINKPEEDKRVKTVDVTKTKGSSFSDFSINKKLLRGILEFGFIRPSPVQEESIPHILMGNNVLCRAKNGTGKTGAYCIPMLQLIDISINNIQALVLVPTRELALQTSRFVKQISKYMIGLNVICTTGGTLLRDDILRFKQKPVHLVVATPGRLLDLAYNGHALLGKCSLVVMDEADKLLSEDFITLIDKILGYIPAQPKENKKKKIKESDAKQRQLLLYSA